MSYTLDSTYLIIGAVALLVGLILGISFGGGARRRAANLAARVKQLELDIDVREAERVRLNRELAAASDQVRPLSDEVDRLRREKESRRAVVAPVAVETDTVPLAAAPLVASDADSPAEDNLTLLKGVGDRFAAKLNEIGIRRFSQLADLTPVQEADADQLLGSFKGRIGRDRLVEQARLLAEGRTTEYEARFGKLGAPDAIS